MPDLVVRRIESLSALRQSATAWNDLWQRSDVALPVTRAEHLALWCEKFAAGRTFQAYVVEQDGQWVAALPLVVTRRWGQIIARLPGNAWSGAGELLVDPCADVERACEQLWQAVAADDWPLIWIDAAPTRAHRWHSLLSAAERCDATHFRRRRYSTYLVRLEHDWRRYLAGRSRNHRQYVSKTLKRSRQEGAELHWHTEFAPQDVDPLVLGCLEIEASGWKGKAHGAVLNTPGMTEFFLFQARLLAASGHLSIPVLEHEGRPIAFEYSWQAKDTYFSPKVGYDEHWARLNPGQLLRTLLLERMQEESALEWVDFLGPTAEATSKWATHDYDIERVLVAPGAMAGRSVVAALDRFWSLADRVRRRPAPSELPVRPLGHGPTPLTESQQAPALVG